MDDLTGTMPRTGLRIDAVIARGGFGAVYRARQIDVDRDVAVKILHARYAIDAEAGRLFRDEIRAIGTVDHRNVVRIFDAGATDDGRLYFVMELLAGRTLAEVAATGPVPIALGVELVRQLLAGLAAVHRAGHVHADVKPSNVVVVPGPTGDRVVLIDFGLARLRAAGGGAEAVGGSRAYMAPEQLARWEVGARSDVFSAALVLLRLVTGWERERVHEVVPELANVADPVVRRALQRALALDPAARPSAADLAAALLGEEPAEPGPAGPAPPFHHLAALTERERGRLFGRVADVTRLAAQLAPGRPVALVAPSGVGKTSLLRAGLAPYLAAAGHTHAYRACRPGEPVALAGAPPRVAIFDQLETLVVGADGGELAATLDHACALVDTRVVLGIREDFAAGILGGHPVLARGVPIIRLQPLDRDGARAALVGPLGEHGAELDPALLDRLLDDLIRAGSELGADLGWGDGDAIYPPHLQLAGDTLWRALAPGETRIELAHYRAAGGLDGMLGDELAHKLAELSANERSIARELFVVLVTGAHARAFRTEAELLALGGRDDDVVRRVLDRLADARLAVRHVGVDGGAAWALSHDSMVPRIEAWLTAQDLERRRLAEALRFHLRQSDPDEPAVLDAKLVRAIDRVPGLVDELEQEWARRPATVWTPQKLVTRSRQLVRYRRALLAAGAASLAIVVAVLATRWLDERAQRAAEARLRDLDLGRIEVVLAPFDRARDPATGALVTRPVSADRVPALSWTWHEPDAADPDSPGRPIDDAHAHRGRIAVTGDAWVEGALEIRGGDAFLVVTGRGDTACPPSVVPVRDLPGYARRAELHRLAIPIPTCSASRFDTIEIPAGPFVHGGAGEPALADDLGELPPERVVDSPTYLIDRTEITNAAFAGFAALDRIHGIWASPYPAELAAAAGPDFPRVDLDWFDARAYCRYLGKQLPTSAQWHKAMRGGLTLDGRANPAPRRNLPWGTADVVGRAAISTGALALASPVAAHPGDVSPYGVVDLAGNAQEWTDDVEPGADERAPVARRPRITRGGNWADTLAEHLLVYMVAENARSPRFRTFYLGARCALAPAPPTRSGVVPGVP